MKTVLIALVLCLAGCSELRFAAEPMAPRAQSLCPSGTLPVYIAHGMTKTFDGCMDIQALRTLR